MPKEVIIRKFNSPREFVEWATNAPTPWNGKLHSRLVKKGSEWSGTHTYEEAYDLAIFGWKDGLNLIAKKLKLAEQIVAPVPRPKIRYDVAGYYPHPGRAAAGEIFNMASPVRPDSLTKQIIKMRYNFGGVASVESSRMITFGAALCSYINALELTNTPVELLACHESDSSGPGVSFQFPLKQGGFNLSLASVVYWLAHPSALRRITFSAMERLDIERWYSDGYGTTHVLTDPGPNVLAFNIDDASGNLQRDLNTIRRKHMSMLDASSPLAKQLQAFNFG